MATPDTTRHVSADRPTGGSFPVDYDSQYDARDSRHHHGHVAAIAGRNGDGAGPATVRLSPSVTRFGLGSRIAIAAVCSGLIWWATLAVIG